MLTSPETPSWLMLRTRWGRRSTLEAVLALATLGAVFGSATGGFWVALPILALFGAAWWLHPRRRALGWALT